MPAESSENFIALLFDHCGIFSCSMGVSKPKRNHSDRKAVRFEYFDFNLLELRDDAHKFELWTDAEIYS